MKTLLRFVFPVSVFVLIGANISRAEDLTQNPRTVYFTVGDAQLNLWTPLDSKASIEAVFDVLHDRYRVSRLLWRGGQDEIWGKEFVIRDQNRYIWRIWEWWRDLQYRVLNSNKLAVEAAHKRGMQIWMAHGIFDNGSQADVSFGGSPYACEDKIRVEHPEWAPVNKYGTWRQGGPIEFCYPGARKAMVDYLTKYVVEGGYDGINFLTYVENHSLSYEDQFGYNQPIVDAFKKRYGVDIRTEPFDKVAWSKLRGEYLTQFFRELHALLSKRGKKIAMSVDGKYPYWPSRWGQKRTAGNLWMDVETWVKEGIVDELSLFHPISDEALQKGVELCKGTEAKLSSWGRPKGDLPPGVSRIFTVNFELESGFDWENYIDWPDEVVPVQPAEALKSSDVYARRRILYAIQKGKQTAPVSDIIPMTKDQDLFVRRAALRVLGELKDSSAIPAIEAALIDPENSVRWQAATVLAQLNAPHFMESLFDAVARTNSTYQFNYRAIPEILGVLQEKKKLTQEQIDFIVRLTDARDGRVREVALYSLLQLDPVPQTDALRKILMKTLASDSEPYARELAVEILQHFPPTPAGFDNILQCLSEESDPVVQVRVCRALANLVMQDSGEPLRERGLKTVAAFFLKYGKGCERVDKDWGWRYVGNSMLLFGDPGKRTLEYFMQKKEDPILADLAWRVVYLPQDNDLFPLTEEQERQNHLKHPFLRFGKDAVQK